MTKRKLKRKVNLVAKLQAIKRKRQKAYKHRGCGEVRIKVPLKGALHPELREHILVPLDTIVKVVKNILKEG